MTTLMMSCPRSGLWTLDTATGRCDLMHPSLVDIHAGLCHYRDGKLLWIYGGHSICEIDRRGIIERRAPLPKPYNDFHSVTWLGHNIFVANTLFNEVTVLDHNFDVLTGVELFDNARDTQDACHLNSLATNGRNVYGTVFDLKMDKATPVTIRTIEGWREGAIGKLLMFDGSKKPRIVMDGLNKPHSLHVRDNMAVICNSGTGNLVFADLQNGITNMLELPKDRFCRGLAITEEGLMYVGFSVYREGDQPTLPSYVSLYNQLGVVQETWNIPPQEVYDIVILED